MYNCKVFFMVKDECIEVFNEDFKTLKLMANELGMSYQQVADISSRKDKYKFMKFKFFPNIEIKKIV